MLYGLNLSRIDILLGAGCLVRKARANNWRTLKEDFLEAFDEIFVFGILKC